VEKKKTCGVGVNNNGDNPAGLKEAPAQTQLPEQTYYITSFRKCQEFCYGLLKFFDNISGISEREQYSGAMRSLAKYKGLGKRRKHTQGFL
jgi:hypothetical protein